MNWEKNEADYKSAETEDVDSKKDSVILAETEKRSLFSKTLDGLATLTAFFSGKKHHPIVEKEANEMMEAAKETVPPITFRCKQFLQRDQKLSATLYLAPRVIFTEQAYDTMVTLVGITNDNEVGWLSTVKRDGMNFWIEETFLPEQNVNAVNCTMSDEGLANVAHEILQKEGDIETLNRLRFWGHSHVDMPTEPSAQDVTQFKTLISNVDDWYIRAIANKKGDLRIDVYICEWGILYENVLWEKYSHRMVDELIRWKKETNQKVRTSSFPYQHYNHKK
ncbi:MAG: hypothetical protein LBG52_04055 [Candidatus Peribacteria bacterium]|jgi:hypothetical protein|nr:hypothetical protein [Candidatus Peribacteria bacterium]